ncbi:hypothetical protein [Nostoc sp. ATCC 53789]|uniref:hypothetical protein n=1 Tax=Nostoc sp. ATCC 53789 TaxID=76335 RepID=UPI00132E9902|nr:hypothetical protein [Nostoc sp. ATCC 53789]QHG21188.1 hypothetical protein GJB62_35660 [Nostoc sp. ATCC 53789]
MKKVGLDDRSEFSLALKQREIKGFENLLDITLQGVPFATYLGSIPVWHCFKMDVFIN